MDPFHQAVEDKIEESSDVGGWVRGPGFICCEMADEAIDVVAWGRGLFSHPMTDEQADRLRRIEAKAHEVWGEIEALKASYG